MDKPALSPTLEDFAKRDESIKKLFLELQASAYGHAATYTAVIIFGGYAGLFTVWSNVKEIIAPWTVYWVGLLIAISMSAFVAFEVFKMVIHSRDMMAIRALVNEDLSPEERDAKRQALAAKTNFFLSKVMIPIWICVLLISIVAGFGAAVLLMTTFIRSLAAA